MISVSRDRRVGRGESGRSTSRDVRERVSCSFREPGISEEAARTRLESFSKQKRSRKTQGGVVEAERRRGLNR